MKKFIGLAGLALMFQLATPAGAFDKNEKKWTVGAAAGYVGGMGFSLERWFGPNNALQINIAPFYYEEKFPQDDDSYSYRNIDSGYSHNGFISVGFNLMHEIAEFRRLQVVSFGGANYLGVYSKDNYYESWQEYVGGPGPETRINHVERFREKQKISAGGGIGAVLNLWRIELSLLLGMRGGYDYVEKTKELLPSADVSVHFML